MIPVSDLCNPHQSPHVVWLPGGLRFSQYSTEDIYKVVRLTPPKAETGALVSAFC